MLLETCPDAKLKCSFPYNTVTKESEFIKQKERVPWQTIYEFFVCHPWLPVMIGGFRMRIIIDVEISHLHKSDGEICMTDKHGECDKAAKIVAIGCLCGIYAANTRQLTLSMKASKFKNLNPLGLETCNFQQINLFFFKETIKGCSERKLSQSMGCVASHEMRRVDRASLSANCRRPLHDNKCEPQICFR